MPNIRGEHDLRDFLVILGGSLHIDDAGQHVVDSDRQCLGWHVGDPALGLSLGLHWKTEGIYLGCLGMRRSDLALFFCAQSIERNAGLPHWCAAFWRCLWRYQWSVAVLIWGDVSDKGQGIRCGVGNASRIYVGSTSSCIGSLYNAERPCKLDDGGIHDEPELRCFGIRSLFRTGNTWTCHGGAWQ